MSAPKAPRAHRALRREVARALAKAIGPEPIRGLASPSGVVLALKPTYLWRGILPNGELFAFTTPTPALEYAGLVDVLADQLLRGHRGSVIIEHSDACRALGVGCICTPTVVSDVVRGEP